MAPVNEVGTIRILPVLPFPSNVFLFNLRQWISHATPTWSSIFTVLVPKDAGTSSGKTRRRTNSAFVLCAVPNYLEQSNTCAL